MTESAYDEIADWYDAWAGSTLQDDPFFPTVEALMGEVAGQQICDLACGNGRVARHLADRGANVFGIDVSAKLLQIALRHEEAEPRGIGYLQADVRTLEEVPNGLFDGIICFMALMDIPDLAPTVRTVVRILRPGGWFVFAILHPCYHTAHSGELWSPKGWTRQVGGYFAEGYWRSGTRMGPPSKVGAYHRMLSTYINTLIEVGLIVERVSEPPATAKLAEARPVWAEVPAVLVIRCRNETWRYSASV